MKMEEGAWIYEFKCAMKKVLGEKLNEDELAKLFMKVDSNCDGTVDWDEFLSFTLLEFQEKDLIKAMAIEVPFGNAAIQIPGKHSEVIVSATFVPLTKSVTMTSMVELQSGGRYLTLGQDGVINVWTKEFRHTRKVSLENSRRNSPWCTALVVLPNVNWIVVATSLTQIWFCDIIKFQRQLTITNLPDSVECLDYWYSSSNCNRCLLLWGDCGGGVTGLQFTEALTTGFGGGAKSEAGESVEISLQKYADNKVAGCKYFRHNQLHSTWVRKVRYIPGLDVFVSCCWASAHTLHVGVLSQASSRQAYIFNIHKGVATFDYSAKFNLICTGGIDSNLKLWDPYVPNQAVNILQGHNSRVDGVFFDPSSESIISLSSDQHCKVWSIVENTCLQTFACHYAILRPHPISAALFEPRHGHLIVAAKDIVYRTRTGNTKHKTVDPKSHKASVTKVLYNPVFESVVSADQNSTVSVWNVKTGEKMMQFSKCHTVEDNGQTKLLEITEMLFDPSYRRLFTGSKNGEIKVWNFNNGCKLEEYFTSDSNEIGGMVYLRNRLYVGGWSKVVHSIFDAKEESEKDSKQFDRKHTEDIQAITQYGNFMISADYNGDIMFWLIDTGTFSFRFNSKEGPRVIPFPPTLVRESSLDPRPHTMACLRSTPASRRGYKTNLICTRPPRLGNSRLNYYGSTRTAGKPKLFTKSAKQVLQNVYDSSSGSHERAVRRVEDSLWSVETLLPLPARIPEVTTATLLSAGNSGWVHGWSCSINGTMVGHFFAGKTKDTPVHCMATEPTNSILITGDGKGYVRVWDISSFAVGEKESKRVKAPHFYSAFFFKNFLLKQSKITASIKPPEILKEVPVYTPPMLVSVRAHCSSVNSLDFSPDKQVLVTAGDDACVRLLSVGGALVGTFGQETLWKLRPSNQVKQCRTQLPTDLKRSASPVSQLILRGKKKHYWDMLKKALFSGDDGSRKKSYSDYDSDDSDSGQPPLTNEDETLQDILTKENFEFDVKSNIFGLAYKSRPATAKVKYIEPINTQAYFDNQVLAYSALNMSEINQLPLLHPPELLMQVLERHKRDHVSLSTSRKCTSIFQLPSRSQSFDETSSCQDTASLKSQSKSAGSGKPIVGAHSVVFEKKVAKKVFLPSL